MQNIQNNNQNTGQRSLLQKAFTFALTPVFKADSSKFLRRSALAALSILAPGGKGVGITSAKSIKRMFHMAANAKKLQPLVRDITNLDTVIDSWPPASIMDMGDASYGIEPSAFLDSVPVTITAYNGTIRDIVEQGLMSEELANSFSNIHCVLVKEQNQAKIDSMGNADPQYRQKLTQTDYDLAISVLLHVTEHFRGKLGFSNVANEHPITIDDLHTYYPHTSRIAVMFEMIDHVQDFLTDMREELTKNIPTPNMIATKLHERGELLGYNGELLPELKDFLLYEHEGPFVNKHLVPENIRDVIKECEQEYYMLASTLPFGYRESMLAFWEHRKEGAMIVEPFFQAPEQTASSKPKLVVIK